MRSATSRHNLSCRRCKASAILRPLSFRDWETCNESHGIRPIRRRRHHAHCLASTRRLAADPGSGCGPWHPRAWRARRRLQDAETTARPLNGEVQADRAFWRARVVILGGAGILCAVNGLAATILTTFESQGFAAAILGIAGVSVFIWFALYAVARIALDDAEMRPAARADFWLAAAAFGAALMPIDWTASFAVLALGLRLAWTGRAGSAERRTGIILLALTGTLIWGRVLLHLIMPSLLDMDAALVAAFADTHADGNLVAFSDGSNFVLGPGCSSLHGMSLALLFWVSVGQLLNRRIGPKSLLICLAGIAAMLAGNLARLVAIARHPADFDYYHAGGGAQIFAWLSLILCTIVILYGYARLADPAEGGRFSRGRARAHAGH
jgi:hypothetical protein